MDRETNFDLIRDRNNHEWKFGRFQICWGHKNGYASFSGGIRFMWLKKSYEKAVEAKSLKMFPGIIRQYRETDMR